MHESSTVHPLGRAPGASQSSSATASWSSHSLFAPLWHRLFTFSKTVMQRFHRTPSLCSRTNRHIKYSRIVPALVTFYAIGLEKASASDVSAHCSCPVLTIATSKTISKSTSTFSTLLQVRCATNSVQSTSTNSIDDLGSKVVATSSFPTSSAVSQISTLPRNDSWVVPESCPWNIAWPLPNTPAPVIDNVAIPQLSIYPRPKAAANLVIVYNYCPYDLWVEPYVGSRIAAVERIPAGNNHSFQMLSDGPAVNLKVSKVEKSFAKPVQIEYSGSKGRISFDVSLIDCLGTTIGPKNGVYVRNGDTSACAGHESGLQIGNDKSLSFQCSPGAWCDDQMYLYEVSSSLWRWKLTI